jgi:hypothetical protein
MEHDTSTPGGATKFSYHSITKMAAYHVWPTHRTQPRTQKSNPHPNHPNPNPRPEPKP